MLANQPVSLAFDVPLNRWMTSNSRDHMMVKARKTRELRAWASLTATKMMREIGHAGFTVPVEITVETNYRGTKPLDDDQCQPTVKALRDGLVDSGLLQDDNPTWVHQTTYKASKRDATMPPGNHRITLTIQQTERRNDDGCI